MDPHYWHQRWENKETGFHQSRVHPLLIRYFGNFNLPKQSRIFVPLCGKSLDLIWFLSQGHRVVGIELSKLAVQQFFDEWKVTPQISEVGSLLSFRAPDLEIFVGDFFNLSKEKLGPIDLIYDRAALVALPKEMRSRYSSHLQTVTASAPKLLICYEYDQNLWQGPPFAIPLDEIKNHDEKFYDVTSLETVEVPGGIRGMIPAQETAYQLNPKGK